MQQRQTAEPKGQVPPTLSLIDIGRLNEDKKRGGEDTEQHETMVDKPPIAEEPDEQEEETPRIDIKRDIKMTDVLRKTTKSLSSSYSYSKIQSKESIDKRMQSEKNLKVETEMKVSEKKEEEEDEGSSDDDSEFDGEEEEMEEDDEEMDEEGEESGEASVTEDEEAQLFVKGKNEGGSDQ